MGGDPIIDPNWAEWINPFGPEFLLGGGTAQEMVSQESWAVQPPRLGGGTAWAQSPSETRRCNRPSQVVQPSGLSLRARLGGATALDRRWHR